MRKEKILVRCLSLLALFFAFLMIGFNIFHTPKFAKDSISLDDEAVAVMAESNLHEDSAQPSDNEYSGEYYQEELITDSASEQWYYNLNTVTFEQLVSLPGIGEVKAEAILQMREDLGGFTSVEQLMDVSGIGEATYETISPYFYIE